MLVDEKCVALATYQPSHDRDHGYVPQRQCHWHSKNKKKTKHINVPKQYDVQLDGYEQKQNTKITRIT